MAIAHSVVQNGGSDRISRGSDNWPQGQGCLIEALLVTSLQINSDFYEKKNEKKVISQLFAS